MTRLRLPLVVLRRYRVLRPQCGVLAALELAVVSGWETVR